LNILLCAFAILFRIKIFPLIHFMSFYHIFICDFDLKAVFDLKIDIEFSLIFFTVLSNKKLLNKCLLSLHNYFLKFVVKISDK
jgi:hypothetical protein